MDNSSTGKYLKIVILCALLSGFISPTIYSNQIQPGDSLYDISHAFDKEDLIRGERLFYGLVYMAEKSINCASCHNTGVSDTLNWNPNAMDISMKFKRKNAKDLSRVLLNPAGKKMAEVHKGFDLVPGDIILIKAYMDSFTAQGLRKEKPVITNFILSIVAVLLMLYSISDLIFIKKVKSKWIHLLILLGTGMFIANRLVVDAIAVGRSRDYSPDQPIKFSHAIHAGQNGTDCLYCHSSAEYSKTAGIPSANVCMNCHLLVRSGTRSGAFEISKVIESYEKNNPIDWIKVHNLPDHVFFSHAQHVGVGNLKCQECHGPVEKMDRITQVTDMSMGWCINCHREKKVNFHDNKFYSEYEDMGKKMKENKIDSVTVEMIGGTDCMKCHY